MRKRVHRVANFLAFNLLFFALYLNFIYKDPTSIPVSVKNQQEPAAFSGTLVDNKTETTHPVAQPVNTEKIAPAKGTH
ncbi:hypothetical protein LZZ85_02265 [Terrimonas sp. NA20]|uniref:Energy transducer TonB n=1 Tax=Terrimonas ginsenosidimutans TaxID=2908004 RepID=A0ABS9KL71_9BACT|nr:hypothetical protein [Terrimonas ginsenosidimutans]MCG2613078.1 hypothetical protein [Terrimonas ginsenosidimutans]